MRQAFMGEAIFFEVNLALALNGLHQPNALVFEEQMSWLLHFNKGKE